MKRSLGFAANILSSVRVIRTHHDLRKQESKQSSTRPRSLSMQEVVELRQTDLIAIAIIEFVRCKKIHPQCDDRPSVDISDKKICARCRKTQPSSSK